MTTLGRFLALVALLPAVAHAETFDERAAAAKQMRHVDDVVWALAAPCDRGDDVQQRQCRQLRDRLAGELAGQTLLVEADAAAFDVEKWNPQTKKARVTLSACVRCAGLEVDGETWFVAAPGARIEGGKVRGAPLLVDTTRAFADETAATAWTTAVKNRRVQMFVKVPAPDKKRGANRLVTLEVTGYRVFTPCNGEVLAASPQSPALPADKEACATGDTRGIASPDGVDALTPQLVAEAMKPVVEAAKKCRAQNGISGTAKIDLTISGDGSVIAFEQTGDLVGTPTAKCIESAMSRVRFAKSKKASTKIAVPIPLP